MVDASNNQISSLGFTFSSFVATCRAVKYAYWVSGSIVVVGERGSEKGEVGYMDPGGSEGLKAEEEVNLVTRFFGFFSLILNIKDARPNEENIWESEVKGVRRPYLSFLHVTVESRGVGVRLSIEERYSRSFLC